ncbi:MAG: helix-turn-helix transcriptional regulator [Planctomycetes bacterium]|nr:helix-turn-helix transcriptional regulator [Planctomycetota bacterium]
MAKAKAVGDLIAERGISLTQLIEASALDRRIVEAIARGQYTPSPQQRQRLAAALGVAVEQVAWGHQVEVAHVYGHGPQFGRSP